MLGAIIPKKSLVGHVTETELILISKLYEDQKGETQIQFQRYLTRRKTDKSLNSLMNQGIIHHYFSEPVSTKISSIKLTYLNSFETLSQYSEGYQMSEQGPDYYFTKYQEVNNPLKLKWNIKEACKYLPIGRKIQKIYYQED